LKQLLKVWGKWQRHSITGIGWSSETIEYKIMKGEILGDGNKGGSKSKSGPNFIENPRAESVNIAVKLLENKYREEINVIKACYIFEWTIHKIAKETGTTRYHVKQLHDRGVILIEGRIE